MKTGEVVTGRLARADVAGTCRTRSRGSERAAMDAGAATDSRSRRGLRPSLPGTLVVVCALTACAARVPLGYIPELGGHRPHDPRSHIPRLALKAAQLTLTRAVRLALRHNPRLATFARDIDAAAGRLIQAKLLPNPTLGASTEDGAVRDAAGFGGENKIVGGLSWTVPLWGRIGAQTDAARRGKEVARLKYEREVRLLIASVKRAFYVVLGAQRAVAIAVSNRSIARELRRRAVQRFQSGAAARTEELRAQIELARAKVNLEQTKAVLETARRRLAALIGDVDLRVAAYQGKLRARFPPLVPATLKHTVLRSHPTILAAKRDVDRARAQIRLAQVAWRPEPTVGIGAGRAREMGQSRAVLEWGLSIPLPLFNRNQGKIAEARALLRRAIEAYRSVLNQTLLRLRRALIRYRRQRKQVGIYTQRILPQARRALDLIRDGYRQGKFTQIDVLDAQRTLVAARQTYLGLRVALVGTTVELEELGGKDLAHFTRRKP